MSQLKEKKMIRRLLAIAATYAKDVFVMKSSPTDKIIFGRKSVAEKSPNKY